MKLALSISLVVAGLAFETAALPNTYSEPHSFFDKRGIPARFEVTGHETINGVKSTTVENKNMSALYGEYEAPSCEHSLMKTSVVIPDDLKNWPWWCGEDRSYCNAAWAPTVGEGNALAQWYESFHFALTQWILTRAQARGQGRCRLYYRAPTKFECRWIHGLRASQQSCQSRHVLHAFWRHRSCMEG